MSFTICYTFQGEDRTIDVPGTSLTPHDAVCYALIDAIADLRQRPLNWEGSHSNIAEIANQHGVTNVTWDHSPAHLQGNDVPHMLETSE